MSDRLAGGRGTSESLDTQLRRAVADGRASEGIAVLAAAARLRPVASHPPHQQDLPAVWLRRTGSPLLICVNSFIPAATNLTYQRLTAALDGRCDVAAVPLPGYLDGEPLPATVDVLADALAIGIGACAGDKPFTLAGFSTGGLAAHVAAHRLVAWGIRPAAVVLIDSFPLSALTNAVATDILHKWAQSPGAFWSHDDTGLSAMGWYLDLFGNGWAPATLTVPVVLIQAADKVLLDPGNDWARDWPGLTAQVTTPGSHFGLLTEYARHTAHTLAGVLGSLDAPPSSG